MEWQMTTTPKIFIVYCTIAGFISAWAISGLLVVIDPISRTPTGTFFGVIGTSLGFTDPTAAQYVGFALHVLTGMAAGNIFGQIALYWHKVIPCNSRHGIVSGMIVGMALWIILFVPLATFGIQPRFINNIKPDFILISITLLENIKTTKRLIKEVRSRLKIPIIIGGPAVNGVNSYDTINVRVMQNASAKELVTLINNMY
jgi:hypothetical protein